MLVEYEGGSPQTLPHKPRQRQMQTEEHSQRKPTICPPFAPCFQMFLYFCPFWSPKIPRKHQSTPKKSLFLPLFSLFQPLLSCSRCSRSPEMPRWVQVLPVLHYQARNGSPQGTRERERGKAATSPQAHKERDTPPLLARGRQPFPSSQIRAKKSGKSRLG